MKQITPNYIVQALDARALQRDGMGERGIAAYMGLSKTNVHRLLIIAKADPELLTAANVHSLEKWVLLDRENLLSDIHKELCRKLIIQGEIKTRADFRRHFNGYYKKEDKTYVKQKKERKNK